MTECDVRAVVSPSAARGGVQSVARTLAEALPAELICGRDGIARSRRPSGQWSAVTWKTFAAMAARHPTAYRAGDVWAHGAELTRDTGAALSRVRGRTLRSARRLLSSSPVVLDLLPAGAADRVQVIGVGLHPRYFGAAPPPEEHGTIELASVGRMVPRKGHDLAIRAAAALARETPVRLHVVGTGPDEARLRALAECEPVDVVWHGAIGEDEKVQLLDSVDALLFLTRAEGREYEGLGIVALEAAARGRPAVVLRNGGSPHCVVDGATGRLVDPASADLVDEVAAAVLELRRYDAQRCRDWAAHFAATAWVERYRRACADPAYRWAWPA